MPRNTSTRSGPRLDTINILIIGAGGLGCEIVKNLVMTGFKRLTVIDMDTVELSNLNRQFLFRVCGKIEDMSDEFYDEFDLVLCGLDSIEARRWVSNHFVSTADPDKQGGIKPIVDGAVEGLRGNVRVIIPTVTSCYECTVSLNSAQPESYPICTIANTPRCPEHCIEWAYMVEWPRQYPDSPLDKDNQDHMQWVHEVALRRARQFGIDEFDYGRTVGVVKRVIPSFAPTNSAIAAYKLATQDALPSNNYLMFNGIEGIFISSLSLDKREDCPVCQSGHRTVRVPRDAVLRDLVSKTLKDEFCIASPSIWLDTGLLYAPAPPRLEMQTRKNLDRRISEVLGDGDDTTLTVFDGAGSKALLLAIKFE
ncbi:NEDD8 activating enzyme [Spiromyces aspiralis]|uniref:NEDD8 activating enzyme n=1 Tax=Spiromyces aspiralis TaxID=68401 RepID=A0ACC1HPT9_9FUNG|nr:NEDD8 activating enzyme [Spiromyces aspiralis]